MKKILLATSILAATTGFAAAEVALTGDARMGVVYDGNDIQFSQRARVQFNLSGQTDTGLEFGASFRAHEAGDAQSGGFASAFDERESVAWVSGAFGKLAMGDVNSAAEEAFGDLSGVGFSGLNDYADIPYISGDGNGPIDQGPGALYSYATGAFEFHLSLTDGNEPYGTDADLQDQFDAAYGVAVAYSADTFKIGLGYLDNGDNPTVAGAPGGYGGSQLIVYGQTEVSGFGLKAYYSDFDDVSALGAFNSFGDVDQSGFTADEVAALLGAEIEKSYGLSADYTFGATTVAGFFRRDEFSFSGFDKADSYGIGAEYDLGGGASFNGGVVDTDFIGAGGETIADLGIKLRF